MSGDPQPNSSTPSQSGLRRWWWVVGLGVAAVIVIVLAPLASPDPDGLESVAGQQGWLENAKDALYSIIPDYAFPGVDDPTVSTILAGLIGVGIVFLAIVGVGWLLRRRRAG